MRTFSTLTPRQRWSLPGAVAVAILVSAVVPTGDSVARIGPFGALTLDLWLHAGAYVVLQLSVLAAVTTAPEPPLAPTLTPLAVVGYGILLEGIQLLVPYRTGSLADAVANAVGVVLALACWRLIVRLR